VASFKTGMKEEGVNMLSCLNLALNTGKLLRRMMAKEGFSLWFRCSVSLHINSEQGANVNAKNKV